jgi:hypothetical protein
LTSRTLPNPSKSQTDPLAVPESGPLSTGAPLVPCRDEPGNIAFDPRNPARAKACDGNLSAWDGLVAFKDYQSRTYPEIDIYAGPINGSKFDLIIAEQVFEHLQYPYRAGKTFWLCSIQVHICF